MVALDAPKESRKKRIPRNVPEELVYEIIEGKPYYYKGYRDVLKKQKTVEEIRASTTFEWTILGYLLELLFKMPAYSKYSIATNEPGLHIDRHNNLAGDIMVFRKEDLPGSAISLQYAAVPAHLHVELDITPDVENETDMFYLSKKINKLLEFGMGKVLWVFTASRQVLVVTHQTEWKWYNWDTDVELMDVVVFNIAGYLEREGIEVI